MKLAKLLTEERVFLSLQATTCTEVMEELVGHLAEQGILLNGMRDRALEALRCREEEISTGVGCGVAIPHAYLEDLAEPVAVFGRSAEGVEFDACDHAPVHFVVMMLIPEAKRGQHLLTLADVGKRFLSCETRQALAAAPDAQTVLSILA
ncbi:PTS sugar transporter subunit IIA [Roseibacillus ishigakijimensis]|uniref:PTS sugar transporter subunit IIA n=1 Tax=Roseibacillus ishigakijimensis TaxID=454146 RepID=A0A934VMY4_9BACT|nr:PTS sugar transporter subunit IIA [Roseibacillus ishigakijimensis]MBK1834455.1 PTS sugar transporter subunit IIA [Roseibacillus ishigakijimensis]